MLPARETHALTDTPAWRPAAADAFARLANGVLSTASSLHVQITASSDRTCRLWDVETGECLAVLEVGDLFVFTRSS